jgi:mono/diheme cytochrome c family protein
MKFFLAAPLSLAALVALSAPVDAADAQKGEALAKRWCAFCHVVAEGQRAGNPDVPSFAAIGSRPNYDAQAVANFLMSPHPVMPNMSLSRAEAADLAAYIGSQKQ